MATKYHLGLRQVFSGSAQTTLGTLVEILDDLDTVRSAIGSANSKAKEHNVGSTFCKKAIFSHAFRFQSHHSSRHHSNWSALSEDEKEQFTRVNNLYCGLHFVVDLAETAEATLKVWESTFGDLEQASGTSGTTWRRISFSFRSSNG